MRDLLILGALVSAIGFFWYLKSADISAEKARELIKHGALLIDVRTASEFAVGHIEGARNIPVGELAKHSGDLGLKARGVIVYCASGARSAMAKRTLRSAGFQEVYNLGGMSNW